MEVFKKHIIKQNRHTKSKLVSTANDKYTLFHSLSPIVHNLEEAELIGVHGQANIKDRIREITTEVNADEVEKFM